MSGTNPFFTSSLLPYQAPQFDLIRDEHYRPAFDEAIRQKRREIAAIAGSADAPDFANTVLALEKSGELLSRVSSVFFAMTSAHTNDYLQQLEEAISTELAALSNDIWLNDALFARVDAIYNDRQAMAPDAESLRLIEVLHQRFILAGARLEEAQKQELKTLNTESASLTSQFNQRLLAADKAGGLVVDYQHQLDGLSPAEQAAAAEAAAEKGLSDRWLIPLLNTTQQPALQQLRDRQTRENLFKAGWLRTQKMMPTIPARWSHVWWRSGRVRLNCWAMVATPAGKLPIRWRKPPTPRCSLCGVSFLPRAVAPCRSRPTFRK